MLYESPGGNQVDGLLPVPTFSCRMHPRLEIRRPGAIFSRSCVKFNDCVGVGVGPRYALFFYLLRDTLVDAYMHGLPVSHGWFVGAEH